MQKINIETCQKKKKKQKENMERIDIDIDKKVLSDKFKHNDKGSKYFIGYKDNDIIRPLCVVLPQMSEYIKYFDNNGKSIPFKIEDDSILVKYNSIWNIKFQSQPVYD